MMKIKTLKLFSLIFECLRRIINIILQKEYVKEQISHEKEEPISVPKKEISELEPPQIVKELESEFKPQEIKKKTPPVVEKIQSIPPEEKKSDTEMTKINILEINKERIEEKKENEIHKKPYRKKPPTEGIEEKTTESKVDKEKSKVHKKSILLGDLKIIRRKRRKRETTERKPVDIEKEETEEKEEEKTITAVQSPFVEIDLDNAEVWIVLPRQELQPSFFKKGDSLGYEVELNEKLKHITASTETDKEGIVYLNGKRVLIEEPLKKFSVNFPAELQSREYIYKHQNIEFYPFIAAGDSHGRLFYLNDSKGNINPLPGREIWVLLHEDFELANEPEVTEEKWVWEKYKPFRVNLSRKKGETEVLIVKNKKTGELKEFLSEKTFRLDGEGLTEDDFSDECPLFTGKIIKIISPIQNPKGWDVWIQNKEAGARRICKGWTGSECLKLEVPKDIPFKFGEFQLDICQENTRISDETLFFRLMPPIKLCFPRELIIPDSQKGHTSCLINIGIFSEENWELNTKKGERFKILAHNHFEIEVPPEKDVSFFSFAIAGMPESTVNFKVSIPRLKWKISGQEEWQSTLQKINKKDLKWGESFYLLINTNDLKKRYDNSSFIEANGRKLQYGKFIRKGTEYWLRLNDFHDTIEREKMGLNLRLEIRTIPEKQLLGSIDLLHFEGESVQEIAKPKKNRGIQAFVKCSHKGTEKKGKGFSKAEISAAGISNKNLQLLNIPYDKRRRSSHLRNINLLKGIKEDSEKEK